MNKLRLPTPGVGLREIMAYAELNVSRQAVEQSRLRSRHAFDLVILSLIEHRTAL